MKTIASVIRQSSILATATLAFAVSSPAAESNNRRPLNEELTSNAWEAFNGNQYAEAIGFAEECIKLFEGDARTMQDELKSADKKTPLPKVGKVSDPEKEEILNRGPLNDVAAAWFIRGEANSKLAAKAEGAPQTKFLAAAQKAYEEAAYYTYARIWDPLGWFWDPAKTANSRLKALPPLRAQK